ncbi:CDP-diacylglycerol--serine O-phosphatidyltransferase [bacterium]|nr:CDP-diacylglycerol--serine O-phosphatidyltransferase [bacterium]
MVLTKSASGERRKRRTKQFIKNQQEVIKTKGIYLIPSLFTLGNLFCGFYAIVLLFSHTSHPTPEALFHKAALLILLAAFLDGIDGKIAKLTNSTSEFGMHLDSIADIISFGMAPGLLVYSWALFPFERIGWLPAFLFLICGALRLARFNVQASKGVDNKYFKGLPIPTGALMIASFVLLVPEVEPLSFLSIVIMVMVYCLSYLMISTIPYRSFKDIDLKQKRSAKVIFFLALFIVIIMLEPSLMIFLLLFVYIVSGIVAYLIPLTWSIDKTLHQDILIPPEDFDELSVKNSGTVAE